MTEQAVPRLLWMQPFLNALGQGETVRAAAQLQGIHPTTAYYRRKHDAAFAEAWHGAREPQGDTRPGNVASRGPHWRKCFIEALAETSSVTAAAARANVPASTVYRERRTDAEFARKWLVALREGYDNLEMELLGYLRDPQPRRKMDVASALRLLAAHRETVARERAVADEEDEQAVLESIDAFIEEIRQRRAANAAILIETASDGAQ
jgi:hypothetical protein